VLFDATTLRLLPKIKQWAASQSDAELPLKVHLRLQASYGGTDRIILAPEKENDAKRYAELLDLEHAPEGEHIYLHDCGPDAVICSSLTARSKLREPANLKPCFFPSRAISSTRSRWIRLPRVKHS